MKENFEHVKHIICRQITYIHNEYLVVAKQNYSALKNLSKKQLTN